MMRDRKLNWLAAGWLVVCILLGGASVTGAVANAVLQATAVIILIFALWFLPQPMPSIGGRWIVGLVVVGLVYVGLTAIPLPPSIWTRLPGHESIARGYELLGVANPWLPIALVPERILRSVLALLPPVATYVLVRRLNQPGQERLVDIVVLAAIVSLALGVLQLAGGPMSHLRPYALTNRDSTVGFFANSNHLATLLLCAIPFAAAAARRRGLANRRSGSLASPILFAVLLIVLAVGILINRSIAGIGLLLPAIVVSIGLFLSGRTVEHRRRGLVMVCGLGALISIGSIAVVSMPNVQSKLQAMPGSRAVATPTTFAAARQFWPFGSGLGSFVQVYGAREPARDVSNTYMNHAHDDYAEILLELGLVGLLLIVAFLGWFLRQAYLTWTDGTRTSAASRAASAAIALMLAHSLVDYPLRTAAMLAIFAMCCALLLSRRENWVTGLEVQGGRDRV